MMHHLRAMEATKMSQPEERQTIFFSMMNLVFSKNVTIFA